MADDDDITPTLSQLLYTFEKVENLARGPLSQPIVHSLRETAISLQCEIAKAPAQSWPELGDKVLLLLNGLPADPTRGWLDAIREGVERDVYRLASTIGSGGLPQAAE